MARKNSLVGTQLDLVPFKTTALSPEGWGLLLLTNILQFCVWFEVVNGKTGQNLSPKLVMARGMGLGVSNPTATWDYFGDF